jgi:hypothetical protein
MDWKADLDALIDQTMTLVKRTHVEHAPPRTIVEANRLPSVNWMSTEREEIGQHVANFKAHQQRLRREREDFAASEWKRMLASRNPS